MRVLLINPMASRKAATKGRRAHFPVGLGLIASYLIENGFSVNVLDNESECLNRNELHAFLSRSDYDVYGISAMAPEYRYVKGLSRMIKELKGRPIILGGPLATYSHETVLKNTSVDVCVIGEGEETIVDLVENLENLEQVAGIAFRESGKVKTTAMRNFKKSRDDYPFPAYELFNMEPYFRKLHVHYEGWGSEFLNRREIGSRNIGMVTGIGCPYQCRFCSRAVNKPRMRSIDNIISEIKYLKTKFRIEGVRFIDELLIINDKRTLELCEKIKPLNVIWSGQARSNTLNEEIASSMKDAGCIGVGLGIESGSDRLLRAMKKQVMVKNHKRAIKAAKENDLSIQVQILYGFPGENRESIDETIGFFKEVELPLRRFNILTPLPGSAVYDECVEKGIIKDEDAYLERVSLLDAGFGSKKVLINLTDMPDGEFESLLLYAEKTMEDNFKKIFKKRHKAWYLLFLKQYVSRQGLRVRNAMAKGAWKRKILRAPERRMTRKELEELYFEL